MQRIDVNALDVPRRLRVKLTAAGFASLEDVLAVSEEELADELGVGLSSIEKLRSSLAGTIEPPSLSALELLQADENTTTTADRFISTGIYALDAMADHAARGLPCGRIAELMGTRGAGITSISIFIALQLCSSCLKSEMVYIDMAGVFSIDRVREIFHLAFPNFIDDSALLGNILTRIHTIRAHDHQQLMTTMEDFPNFLAEHPKVRLVVIDDIYTPFTYGIDSSIQRSRILNQFGYRLRCVAYKHQVTILVLNKLQRRQGTSHWSYSPAFGDAWGHTPSVRMALYKKRDQRYLVAVKSPAEISSSIQLDPLPFFDADTTEPEPIGKRKHSDSRSDD